MGLALTTTVLNVPLEAIKAQYIAHGTYMYASVNTGVIRFEYSRSLPENIQLLQLLLVV